LPWTSQERSVLVIKAVALYDNEKLLSFVDELMEWVRQHNDSTATSLLKLFV